MKLSPRMFFLLFPIVGLMILAVTGQVVPPATDYQAQMRVWLAARATGITVLLLLTVMVVLGLALSHPEQAQWKQAKRIYPWHETLWVFVIAFVAVHIAAIVLDPYANVSVVGAFLPGLSKYRTVPVALGSIALYATLLTGATARWTRLLPSGLWLKLHRFAAVALVLGWVHGVLSGTDTGALALLYWGTAVVTVAAAAYRYWIVRRRAERAAHAAARPTAAAAPGVHEPAHAPIRRPVPLPVPVAVSASDRLEESDVR